MAASSSSSALPLTLTLQGTRVPPPAQRCDMFELIQHIQAKQTCHHALKTMRQNPVIGEIKHRPLTPHLEEEREKTLHYQREVQYGGKNKIINKKRKKKGAIHKCPVGSHGRIIR